MDFEDFVPNDAPADPEAEAVFNDFWNLQPVAQVPFHPIDNQAERAAYTAPVADVQFGQHDGTREAAFAFHEGQAAGAAAAHQLTEAEARLLPVRRDERRLLDRFAVPPPANAGRPDQMVGDTAPLMLDEPHGGVGALRLNDFWLQPDFPRLAYPAVWLEEHMFREGFIDAAIGGPHLDQYGPVFVGATFNQIPGDFRRAVMGLAREGRINIRQGGAALYWATRNPDDVHFTHLALDDHTNEVIDPALARLVGAQFHGAAGMRWRRFHAVFRDAFDRAVRDHETDWHTGRFTARDEAMDAVARYAIEHNIHIGGGTPRFVTERALRLNDNAVLQGGSPFSLGAALREFFDPGGGSMGSM